jgi:hypothetical protein
VPPAAGGVVGQSTVRAICGAVTMGQVAVATSLTGVPHRLVAVAFSVSVTEQLVGAT